MAVVLGPGDWQPFEKACGNDVHFTQDRVVLRQRMREAVERRAKRGLFVVKGAN